MTGLGTAPAVAINAVPVLTARRMPCVTLKPGHDNIGQRKRSTIATILRRSRHHDSPVDAGRKSSGVAVLPLRRDLSRANPGWRRRRPPMILGWMARPSVPWGRGGSPRGGSIAVFHRKINALELWGADNLLSRIESPL
jgi:hypothetical protein